MSEDRPGGHDQDHEHDHENGGVAADAMSSIQGVLRIRRRFYSAPAGQPRVRRATDVVGLAVSLLLLVGIVAAQPPGTLELALLRFLEAFPDWLEPVWGFLIGLLALWALFLLLVPLVKRPRITLEAVLAVVLAVLLAYLSARSATGHWEGVEHASGLDNTIRFPSVRLAAAFAVVAVVNAHLARPYGSIGRWLLLLGSTGALLDARTTVGGTIAACVIGLAAGAAVRLALGSSAGRPSIDDVRAGLVALGVRAHDVEASERQVAGVFLVTGQDDEPGELAIKVYGRDAYDSQLIAKLWRTVWYRDSGSSGGLSRARPAESEALITLLARNAAVPTPVVLTAGESAAGDALVALRVSGRLLTTVSAEELDDALLARCWEAVEKLGDAHLAHRQISPTAVRIDGASVMLVDLGGGSVAPGREEHLTDRAQMLATTASVAGPERAIAAAIAALGSEQVAELLPYLQQAAFGGELRRALKAAEIDVDDLRKATAAATDAPEPELVRLYRVTWGSLVQVGLLMLAAAAILSFIGGVDLGEFWEDLQGASWGWIVAASIVAQLPRVTQAISTRGAIPVQLPFGPVYILQLATSYLNLALPSSIARMAVSVRFFQRQGVAPAVAVTSGAIDSLTNTVIQALLLILLLLFSSATLNLDLNAPDTSDLWHLLILLGAVLVLVVLGVAFLPIGKRLRGNLRERIHKWWPEVKGTFSALRGSGKLAALILGNIGTELCSRPRSGCSVAHWASRSRSRSCWSSTSACRSSRPSSPCPAASASSRAACWWASRQPGCRSRRRSRRR